MLNDSEELTAQKPVKLTQHALRQHAVQALFSLEVRVSLLESLKARDKKRLADESDRQLLQKMLVAPLTEIAAINFALDGQAIINPDYLNQLVAGTLSALTELDTALQTRLTKNWSMSRLTLIDKTILRLGLYELTHTTTPPKVAIDEAINLAHDFSDDAAAALINGILTQFIPLNKEQAK